MIHEIRTYTLIPGGVPEYLRIYNEIGRAVQVRLLGNLIALLQPETGDLNQLVYIWGFKDLAIRTERRATLAADSEFAAYRKAVRHLLVRQENRLLTVA
jgi:hypothetical protein